MIYFSSGAALWKPDSPYGFSKRIIENMNHNHVKIVRIFGSYGPYEKSTRFTAAVAKGFVTIHQDRLFDFIHVHDIMRIVEHIIKNYTNVPKIIDAVYPGDPLKLSEFAKLYGANYIIINEELGEPYIANRDIKNQTNN
jgi:nucleoside-diphosphate-sugar epimerase